MLVTLEEPVLSMYVGVDGTDALVAFEEMVFSA